MEALFDRWREALSPPKVEDPEPVAMIAFWLNRKDDPNAAVENRAFGFDLETAARLGLVELPN